MPPSYRIIWLRVAPSSTPWRFLPPLRYMAPLRCIVLLVLLTLVFGRAPLPCAISPLCVCGDDHLDCHAVPFHRFPETDSDMPLHDGDFDIISCAVDADLVHVSVSAAQLGELSESALDGRALSTLVLVASRLHHIENGALSSMTTSLASLDLGYNEFTEVPLEALRHLKALNWLNLQNNYISHLDSNMDWGGLSETLSTLLISNNHICTIGESAFFSLRHLAQLEIDGNKLKQLDAGILPKSLAFLRLSDNLLSDLPCKALVQLPRLRHLHLRNNILQPISNITCRSERSKIDFLDLSHNELTDSFNFEFHRNLQLKQLVLDLNDFTTVPTFVLYCGQLEKISISYNNLQHISDSIFFALKHSLQSFKVDHNEITSLPDSIKELNRLRYLSMTYNRIKDLKELPPMLHSLLLTGNHFTSFPTGLKNLTTAILSYLDLGYNRISYVTVEHFGLWSKSLTTLILSGNRIAHLTLGSFPKLPLRELVLSFNDIYYMEKGVFANLTQLRILELSSAILSKDISIGFGLESLTWLGLDNNNINYISSDDIQKFLALEYLNLDFNKIIEFPSELRKTSGSYILKELRLSYNYISKINSEFLEELSELQSIDLSFNQMYNISKRNFANLRKLVYLNLAGNFIDFIAEEAFADLPNIEVLDLQENNLAMFSLRCFVNISNYESIFAVNVSNNNIESLYGGPAVFINVLDLSYNWLETLPQDFFNSLGEHVRQIFLSNNKLITIDNAAFRLLINLNILDLQNNNINLIKRRALSEMIFLHILDLSKNQISQLSVEQFHSLYSLRVLRLEGNKLRALPRDVFKNTLLEYLDLSNNHLTLFPSSALAQIGFTLRRLEISQNKIEHLDAAMFHATTFLHELGLARNALTVLSDNTLAGLPRLRRLDLSFNAIKTNFKELFHNVPHLRRLSLANTGLKSAPHLPLPNLAELNLSNNYITSYSEIDLRHLINLKALDIAGNKFTTLRPAMWVAVPKLISLDVSRNPIVRIQSGLFVGLERLFYLKMNSLRYLETIEPRSFRALMSLRSITLEDPAGETKEVPIAEIVSAIPYIEMLTVHIRKKSLDSQFLGLRAPKLKALEVQGATIRTVAAEAFTAFRKQRALTLSLSGSKVSELPAGLALPLAHIPHLTLDLTDNQLVSFGPAVLYPNLTGWNRYATKLVSGGLLLAGNPLQCECSASWLGTWLRRWISEVGSGSWHARAIARRSTCVTTRSERRTLLGLHVDEAECHASVLSSLSSALCPCSFSYTFLLVIILYTVSWYIVSKVI